MSRLLAAVLAGVAVLTAVGVEVVRRWALRRLLDIPNARSSHQQPTPRGGGAAIVVTTVLGWGAFVLITQGSFTRGELGYLAGALLVAGVSWLDDLRTLASTTRLATHAGVAAVALASLGWWTALELPLAGTVSLGSLGIVVTALWIVGLTNAYNFMDGIDGIAGGQGVVAGLGWALLGARSGAPAVAALGAVLAVSCAVFLRWNWAPARIFMGDVGSAFLGFSFAALPPLAAREAGTAALLGRWPVLGFLLVWPFVLDTVITFLRRLARGERVLEAHRSHLYQRLTPAGRPHAPVSLLYTGLAALGLGLALAPAGPVQALAVVLGLPLAVLGLWLAVRQRERATR